MENKGSTIADKIRGCLIGGAAGDALGYVVEFYSEKAIFNKYGPGGIRAYVLQPASQKAVISDDTQMTLFTANGLLVGETQYLVTGKAKRPSLVVATAYLDWLCTQDIDADARDTLKTDGRQHISWLLDVPELFRSRAPGNTCLLSLYRQEDTGVCGSIEQPPNNSRGCGGVMRVAPMGLRPYPHEDITAIDKEGARLAAITHGHSLAYLPAAILTHIIHRLVYPHAEMTLREVVEEATQTVGQIFSADPHVGKMTDLMALAVRLAENDAGDLENIHLLGEGWVGDEALAIAVYCALRYQNDFSKGLITAVNHKGDSDSTGSIAGNILGARLGLDAIDDKWKTDLELYDVILELADDLHHGCRILKDGSFADPAWERKYVHMRRE